VLERSFPALNGYGLFEADHPGTLDHLQPGFGFALSYRSSVITVRDGLLDALFAGHLRAGFGLLDQFQVSVGFPFLLLRDGDTTVTSEGLGDGFIALKGRVFGDPRDGLSLGARVAATLPIGTNGEYLRDVRGPLGTWLLMGYREGRVAMILNAGAGFGRDAAVGDQRYGDEAVGIAGLSFDLIPESVALGAEAVGRMPMGEDDATPWLEARGGLKTLLGKESLLTLSGGTAFGDAFGVPGWSLLIGWAFEPRSRDPDGDGVYDDWDQCPGAAEDRDGYADEDGCPDEDNDGDGVPDVRDGCPELAEDDNDYADEDGCPDAYDDVDGDGVYDVMDLCMHDPEDRDGHRDFDGCPDLDDDDDGVPDTDDRCPAEREDLDGFEDGDGCADLDNDGDHIADLEDGCPNQAEDYNGVRDRDGCPETPPERDEEDAPPERPGPEPEPAEPEPPAEVPDAPPAPQAPVAPDVPEAAPEPSETPERPAPAGGPPLARLSGDLIEVGEPIQFQSNSARILATSLPVLDAVAGIIKGDPGIRRVRVEGHTDGKGVRGWNLTLSKRRARAVVTHLVRSGISPRRLIARGFGPDRPIASNMTADGRAENRRVEFIIER